MYKDKAIVKLGLIRLRHPPSHKAMARQGLRRDKLGLFWTWRVANRWSLVVSNKEVTFILPIPKLGLFCIVFRGEGSRWEVAKVHRYRGTKVQRCKVAEVQSCKGAKKWGWERKFRAKINEIIFKIQMLQIPFSVQRIANSVWRRATALRAGPAGPVTCLSGLSFACWQTWAVLYQILNRCQANF